VVLELDALTNADKTFLIEALLLWIHHYRMAQDQRETFKHAIVIEEAHHILLRKKQEATGEETITDVLLREIRELGESIICLDQHPSLISKPALGNTYTTFAMNLKHRGDIAMIQDSLLLTSEQAGYLGRLEVGWSIVRLQGRWFWPFLVKFPLVKFEKGMISDERLRVITKQKQEDFSSLLSPYSNFSATISTKKGELEPEKPYKGSITTISQLDKDNYKDRQKKVTLTAHELMFLKNISEHITLTVTKRYAHLGFNLRAGNDIRKSLVSKGLICSVNLSFYKGGVKGLLLTSEGQKVLGIKPSQSNRNGSPEHRYWVKAVAEHLKKQGYKVTEEAPIGGGKTIDVLANQNGKKIAFEVETGKSDVPANIKKCLDTGLDRVVVVTTSTDADKRIRACLADSPQAEIIKAPAVLKQDW